MPKIISVFAVALLFNTSAYADGSNWDAFQNLARNRDSLTIVTEKGKTAYVKGEKLKMGISIDKSGYLNVISIDSSDKVTVLFPNKYHPDNQVSAGGFTLPTRKMNFDLTTRAPFGKTLVAAFLTNAKVNLYLSKAKSLNSDKQIFAELSGDDVVNFSKAFEPTGKQSDSAKLPDNAESQQETKHKSKVGKLELITCETAESC